MAQLYVTILITLDLTYTNTGEYHQQKFLIKKKYIELYWCKFQSPMILFELHEVIILNLLIFPLLNIQLQRKKALDRSFFWLIILSTDTTKRLLVL